MANAAGSGGGATPHQRETGQNVRGFGDFKMPPDHFPTLKQHTDKGAEPKAPGVKRLSARLRFAQSAEACGSGLTRRCLMDHASATTAPDNSGNGGLRCFVVLKAAPNGFVPNKV